VDNVEYVAFCDVYDRNAVRAKEALGGNGPTLKDFRKVMEMKDVDAVHNGTPDHWHAIPSIAALEAGKHVYCEKPIEHTVQEGLAMIEAAKKYPKSIFLTGTQHRSAPHIMRAAEWVQGGKIGEVHFVSVWNYSNMMPDGFGSAPDGEPPEDMDWSFYLGPAPMVPYNPIRHGGSYRAFSDYSGGRLADFGVHRFDSVHHIMGAEKPTSCNATGARFCLGGMGDHPDVLQATYEYPGWVMAYEAMEVNGFGSMARITPGLPHHGSSPNGKNRPNGMMFVGTEATLIVDRRALELIPETRRRRRGDPSPEESKVEPFAEGYDEPTPLHAQHFIACIRDGEKVRTDAVTGHRAGNIAQLANISYRVGRKIKWDPDKEVIIDDPEASQLLGKKARKPWDMITL
jgi:predicted dehydrogenase